MREHTHLHMWIVRSPSWPSCACNDTCHTSRSVGVLVAGSWADRSAIMSWLIFLAFLPPFLPPAVLKAMLQHCRCGCFHDWQFVCLLVGCLMSQQHVSVSQGWICRNFTCCHTEVEVADQTFYPTQSQYTDTGLTSPSADPIMPSAWQGSHWSANFWVTGMTRPRKNPGASGIRTRDLPFSRRTP